MRQTSGKVSYLNPPDFPPEDGNVLIFCAVSANSDARLTTII